MGRTDEIDKIVDEIGDADSLYEFAEGIYEDRQRIEELEEQLKNATKQVRKEACEEIRSELDKISGEHEVKVKGGIGKFTCIPRYLLEQLLDQLQGE